MLQINLEDSEEVTITGIVFDPIRFAECIHNHLFSTLHSVERVPHTEGMVVGVANNGTTVT